MLPRASRVIARIVDTYVVSISSPRAKLTPAQTVKQKGLSGSRATQARQGYSLSIWIETGTGFDTMSRTGENLISSSNCSAGAFDLIAKWTRISL